MPAAAELSLYRTRCEAVSLSSGVALGGLVSGLAAPPDAEATTANTVPAAAPVAATRGVRVDDHARDDLGRPAVEISRTATATGIEDQTFENPKTGAVLETAFIFKDGTKGTDLYLSVTSSSTVPPNPYR